MGSEVLAVGVRSAAAAAVWGVAVVTVEVVAVLEIPGPEVVRPLLGVLFSGSGGLLYCLKICDIGAIITGWVIGELFPGAGERVPEEIL